MKEQPKTQSLGSLFEEQTLMTTDPGAVKNRTRVDIEDPETKAKRNRINPSRESYQNWVNGR